MSIFLDMPETCQRFGHYISEFRSLLDANQIHHGSPNDIFEFSEMLESSSEFRLDLSAMVKSVVQREDILLTDMMTIIVTSVGGSSFTDIHSSTITEPTKTLMEVLLGTGCWRQFGQYSPPPLSQQAAPSFKQPVRAKEPPHTPPSPPTPASPPTPDIPAATEEPENLTGLLDASNELRRMLTVLENNTEQVKRHLDSIEQRIHQIEPLPEVPPVQTPPPPAPLPHSESAEIVLNESVQPVAEETPAVVAEETPVVAEAIPVVTEAIPVFDVELPTRGRAVFSQQPEESQTNDFQSPTFAYAAEKGRSMVPIGVSLALLAIIAAFLFFTPSGQKLKASIFSSAAAVPPVQTQIVPSGAPTLPAPNVPPTADRTVTEITPTYSETSNDADPGISPNAPSTPVKPKIRYIPANVMEGYLLSAPRPEYPPLARTNHIEGSVSLQATISKTGSVETLHVIRGPQPLLGAAVDAVRNWRYKPYSVDSQPVEVTTTVYVDFSLRPPPAKAY